MERRYPRELAVIGVHSAKFPTERESAHLRHAVRRLEIDHPVVNDRDFAVWQGYAVRAWPTIMFVDPRGRVIGKHEGEFHVEQLAPVIDAMLAEFDSAGLMDREPVAGLTHAPLSALPDTALAYPGKVLADAATDRLYIADTNHNRVVVTTLAGEVVRVFGDGAAGLADGVADPAQFDHPQGLALNGNALYVADTENHAIRRVDLETGAVVTIAGTGEQARRYLSGGPALETPLTSPWDVVVAGDTLYIAMAGNHQLWMHQIGSDEDEVRRFAGSGHEGLRDGPTASAWLAQPSGLTRLGEQLLFTDSETSSVRTADLPGRGAGLVTTLVGEDLFEFGDIDGDAATARLQHPLGVAYDPATGLIYIADTYNNKIKRLDPRLRIIETWVTGLNEPAGVSIAGGHLYIADTNHHVIRRADLATGATEVVEITGL